MHFILRERPTSLAPALMRHATSRAHEPALRFLDGHPLLAIKLVAGIRDVLRCDVSPAPAGEGLSADGKALVSAAIC